MTYPEWCLANGYDHAHCPQGCEKPGPFVLADGRLICGRCAVKYGEEVEMVPCVPEVCEKWPPPTS